MTNLFLHPSLCFAHGKTLVQEEKQNPSDESPSGDERERAIFQASMDLLMVIDVLQGFLECR